MTEDTQFANRKSRTESLDKLPVKSAQDAADEAFKKEPKVTLQAVKVPPKPILAPTVTIFEALWAWLVGFAKQQVVNSFDGKPVANPLSFVSVLTSWRAVLIGLVVLLLVIVALKWIL